MINQSPPWDISDDVMIPYCFGLLSDIDITPEEFHKILPIAIKERDQKIKNRLEKADEKNYTATAENLLKSILLGKVGEYAERKMRGDHRKANGEINIDTTLGLAKDHNYPDLMYGKHKRRIGVKTSAYPYPPYVYPSDTYPQILCILFPWNAVRDKDGNYLMISRITICGIAFPELLRKYAGEQYMRYKCNKSDSKLGLSGEIYHELIFPTDPDYIDIINRCGA